jgi:glycosyltransferase involved in cell wall biosynthesis
LLKPKIIFLGPLPPPLMGPSIATEVILTSRLKEKFKLIHLDTSDHRDLDTLNRVDFTNVFLALKHYYMLLWLIVTRWPAMVYIPISQTTLGYLRDTWFIVISKIFRRRVVCHLRGGNFKNWYDAAGPFTRWFVRRIHSLVDGQIVLGKTLRYLFDGIVSQEKIYVVPNGRDFDEIYNEKHHKSRFNVLFLSTFDKTKGVLDVVNAIPEVSELHPDVEFIIAGNWHKKDVTEELKKYVKNNQTHPITIVAPAHGKRKYELLNNADIFVFPTYYPPEGHPWVIIEAMAAGLPIISTDQGAITESVIDGKNGFIVEKQNPGQIAKKIKLLIKNSELRNNMGKASRHIYEMKFTEKHMVDNLKFCFNTVLIR